MMLLIRHPYDEWRRRSLGRHPSQRRNWIGGNHLEIAVTAGQTGRPPWSCPIPSATAHCVCIRTRMLSLDDYSRRNLFVDFGPFQWEVLFDLFFLVHINTLEFDLEKTSSRFKFWVKLPFSNQHCFDINFIGKMLGFLHFSILHTLIYSTAKILVI